MCVCVRVCVCVLQASNKGLNFGRGDGRKGKERKKKKARKKEIVGDGRDLSLHHEIGFAQFLITSKRFPGNEQPHTR